MSARYRCRCVLLCGALMLLLTRAVLAQCPSGFVTNIDGPFCCGLDRFGSAIALHDQQLFVGASERTVPENIQHAGVVYVFHRSNATWQPQQVLQASDPAESASFGLAVAAEDGTLVVGAPHRAGGQGAVYVFQHDETTGWTQSQVLTPNDVVQPRSFGISTAISSDAIVVGAENDNEGGPNAGAAYVFRRIAGTWIQESKLTASDAEGGGTPGDSYAAYFGLSVGIDGSRVVVGAHGQDGVGEVSGAAYVFEYDGAAWVERAKLTPDESGEWDYFGYPVTVLGNRIVASAYNATVDGAQPGVAYVFDYDGSHWSQSAKLIPSDAASGDEAIWTAIQGSMVLVGASSHRNGSDPNRWLGATYLFDECGGEWSEIGKIVASDASVMGQFGRAVAIDGNSIAIGAFNSVPGKVYTYEYAGDCPLPSVQAAGSRYVRVGLDSLDPAALIAIEVTHADCPCLIRYVDEYGFLTETPTVRTASEWGTVYIGDAEVVPGESYQVAIRTDSFRGRRIAATTWNWGDTNNDGTVDLDDILCVLRGFGGDFTGCTLHGADIVGGFFNPDRTVNLDDVLAVLATFSHAPYAASTACP